MGSLPPEEEKETTTTCPETTSYFLRHWKPPHPRSGIASHHIISNPKLAKSLQHLNNSEQPQSPLIRPKSCVNLRFGAEGSSDDKLRNHPRCRKYAGMLLALFASLVFSLASIIVKSVSEVYHPYTLSLWTFQGIFLPSFAVLIYQATWKRDKGRACGQLWPLSQKGNLTNVVLVLLRAIAGAGGTILKVYSLQFMTAADSTVIAFSSPIFVVIVAWLCLDEKCGFVPILAAVLVLVGVGLLTRPPWLTGQKEFDTELLIGCSMAFTCMMLGVFSVIILRYIRAVHYSTITFVYGLIGTVGSGILCWREEDALKLPESVEHWFYALGVAAFTFLGQTTLTLAFKYEEAGPISLIRPSEILFIFAWQFVFLNKIPDWLSLMGAFIVLVGVVTVTIRKWLSTMAEENKDTGKSNTCQLLRS